MPLNIIHLGKIAVDISNQRGDYEKGSPNMAPFLAT